MNLSAAVAGLLLLVSLSTSMTIGKGAIVYIANNISPCFSPSWPIDLPLLGNGRVPFGWLESWRLFMSVWMVSEAYINYERIYFAVKHRNIVALFHLNSPIPIGTADSDQHSKNKKGFWLLYYRMRVSKFKKRVNLRWLEVKKYFVFILWIISQLCTRISIFSLVSAFKKLPLVQSNHNISSLVAE